MPSRVGPSATSGWVLAAAPTVAPAPTIERCIGFGTCLDLAKATATAPMPGPQREFGDSPHIGPLQRLCHLFCPAQGARARAHARPSAEIWCPAPHADRFGNPPPIG